MRRHILEDHHKEHLRRIGVSEIPEHIEISDAEYREHYKAWQRTKPRASREYLHMKALANAAWKRHSEPKPPKEVKPINVLGTDHTRELRWLIGVLALIALLLILQPKAHAQFSKINSITTKQGGSSVGFHASPFNINCGANLTCTDDGSTFNMVAGSGATVAWDAILNPTAGGLSIQMFANGNALFTVKRKTDTAPTGSFFDFQNAAGGSLCKLNIDGSLTGCSISAASQLPVVDVPHGGTGLATLAAHQLYLGNGISAPTPIPSGTNGQLLQSLGPGADPGFADPIVSGPDAVAATPTKNPIQIGCLFLTTPATLTNNQVGAGQCDATQNFLVNVKTSALPAGAATETTLGTRLAESTFTGRINTQGQKAMAASTPVVLASDQASIPVAATLGAETTKVIGTVRVQGNVGGVMDAVIGAAAPANVLAEGLKDTAGNSQAALSDTNGRQIVKFYPDTTTTSYHASKKFAASSTTDVAVMPGNATNKVILDKVTLTCTQTTAGQINVELVKRSVADTVGTSASITAVPDYSSYAGAVSAPLSYTGTGPTVGAAVGDLDNAQIGCMAAATATPNDIYVFKPAKPIILNGTAEQVAINLGGAITGGNITVTFDWRETTTP